MKKLLLSAASFAVVAVTAMVSAPATSEAVPAFARQTGAACLSCHFQAIPRLSAFGRNFRMNAFRSMGEQALLEDEHLSLPAVFNMSFLMKARVSTGKTTNSLGVITAQGGVIGTAPTAASTALQFPDETALLFGGRVGEHAGMLVEMGYVPGAMDMLGYKIAYVIDIDAGIVALTLGTSDALGLASIFNDPSNAISRNIRGVQTRARSLRATNMHTAATAVGIYAYLADMVYVAAGGFVDAGGGTVGNAGVDMTLSPYLRAAYTGEIAGFDLVAGAWYSNAQNANYKQLALMKGSRKVVGLDVQLQGDVGDFSVGFYMPVVLSSKGDANYLPQANTKVTGFMPYVNIAMGAVGVRLGYDYSKSTSSLTNIDVKDNTIVFGAWYDVAQNLTLDLEFDGRKQTTAGLTTLKSNATTLQLEYVY